MGEGPSFGRSSSESFEEEEKEEKQSVAALAHLGVLGKGCTSRVIIGSRRGLATYERNLKKTSATC